MPQKSVKDDVKQPFSIPEHINVSQKPFSSVKTEKLVKSSYQPVECILELNKN